jgi:hypothetical protein
MIIKHTTENVDEYVEACTLSAPKRQEHGSKGTRIYTSRDNPNEVFFVTEWAEPHQALEYMDTFPERSARRGISDAVLWYLDLRVELGA